MKEDDTQISRDNFYAPTLADSPEIVESLVRTVQGRDLEIEAPFSKNETPSRGPIKNSGVIFSPNERPYLFFRLEWVAEERDDGWHLIEAPEHEDELEAYNRWVIGAKSYLENVYFDQDEEGCIYLDDPTCHFIIIHKVGDNLNKEDLISP